MTIVVVADIENDLKTISLREMGGMKRRLCHIIQLHSSIKRLTLKFLKWEKKFPKEC